MLKPLQLLVLLAIVLSFSAFGQTGSISGEVKETKSKEPIIGATVVIQGTSKGSPTNLDGKYKISELEPGTYTLVVSSLSFISKTFKGIVVKSGQNTVLNASLDEQAIEAQGVTVVGERRKDTDINLMQTLKSTQIVASGISAQQILKAPDRDAAQVMSRLPGVTVQDNRFVMIRGVSPRYNNVLINNAIAPNTEVDSRSFSFDLIPSNLLDRMLVFKSGSADQPGDFAGGLIHIYTKNVVNENETAVSIGTGLRANTTFNPHMSSQTSSTDFLGFDRNLRSLPTSFPINLQDVNQSQRNSFAKELPNNFGLNKSNASPDLRIGFHIARKFTIGNVAVSNLTAVNYSSTFQFVNFKRYRYGAFDPGMNRSQDTLFSYSDDQYSKENRFGFIHNWLFRLDERNKIEFKNMFNQVGETETTERNGFNFERRADDLRNYSYRYVSRTIFSSQIVGEHELGNESKFNWVLGGNYIARNEPDYRRVRTYKRRGTNDDYQLIEAASSGAIFETGRFYSKLREGSVNGSGHYERVIAHTADTGKVILKVGGLFDARSRQFDARYFVFLGPFTNDPDRRLQLLTNPVDRLFAPENIGNDGFRLEEGTRPIDSYGASNKLGAGYASISLPYQDYNITAGIRGEYNVQQLRTNDNNGPLEVNYPIFSPLPFLNASRNISKKLLVRLAYSKTVNRPEFRELAPFVYYDFNLDANFFGNNKLKTANIHNLDLRWELYPSKGELICFGVFYKRFVNPIEVKVSPIGLSPQYTFANARIANNLGLESEIRRSLQHVVDNRYLSRLSFVVNAAYIWSRVDLGEVTAQESKRALQGQSPYVVNIGAYYTNDEKGFTANLMYNIAGKRIFTVGDNLFPTVYELPRHQIDFTLSKTLSKVIDLRFSIADILNYKFRFYQDTNRDTKITKIDEPIMEFRRGSYSSLSVVARF